MTTTKSAPLDYLHRTQSTGQRQPPDVRDVDDHAAHLLRLVLDLQLDALLLGRGAGAVEESRGRPVYPPSTPDVLGSAPWSRWALEDIVLARALAAEAVNSGAALPATLGSEPAAQEEHVVLARLAARYESMRALLTDLLDRAVEDPARGYAQLQALMAHCRKRLSELHTMAATSRSAAAGTHPGSHGYLPGELLG